MGWLLQLRLLLLEFGFVCCVSVTITETHPQTGTLAPRSFFFWHRRDLKQHLCSKSVGCCPIKLVLLDFIGEMLQSDEHHPPLVPHGVPSAMMLFSGAVAKLTPHPASYHGRRTDTIFPSPPPCWQQLMTAAILKIKQEMISIGDVVVDREKWGRSEVQSFFHVSAGALQTCCRGINVCAAFHVVETPLLVFVVATTKTYCGGCPPDLGPNAAGCNAAAFC